MSWLLLPSVFRPHAVGRALLAVKLGALVQACNVSDATTPMQVSPEAGPSVSAATDLQTTSGDFSTSSTAVSNPSEEHGSGATAPVVATSDSDVMTTMTNSLDGHPSTIAPTSDSSSSTALQTTGDSGGESVTSGGSGSESGGSTTSAEPLTPVTVFLAGDSTVSEYADTASESDQAGWGQMLHEYLDERVTVDNRAIGGRTARRFIDDGALDAIGDELSPGNVLMVQFGTNDGNRTATYELDGEDIPYYLEPDTDFKMYLRIYIDLALAHGATPILVTPPPRNSAYCTGGNGTGAHAEAMRTLAEERGIAVVDLNARSVEYLQAICPAPTPEDFFFVRSDGSVDGTHFQEHGARVLAGLVAEELLRLGARLGNYVIDR